MEMHMHQDDNARRLVPPGTRAGKSAIAVPRALCAFAAVAATALTIGLLVVWPARIEQAGAASAAQGAAQDVAAAGVTAARPFPVQVTVLGTGATEQGRSGLIGAGEGARTSLGNNDRATLLDARRSPPARAPQPSDLSSYPFAALGRSRSAR
jgi:hypothetical protein